MPHTPTTACTLSATAVDRLVETWRQRRRFRADVARTTRQDALRLIAEHRARFAATTARAAHYSDARISTRERLARDPGNRQLAAELQHLTHQAERERVGLEVLAEQITADEAWADRLACVADDPEPRAPRPCRPSLLTRTVRAPRRACGSSGRPAGRPARRSASTTSSASSGDDGSGSPCPRDYLATGAGR